MRDERANGQTFFSLLCHVATYTPPGRLSCHPRAQGSQDTRTNNPIQTNRPPPIGPPHTRTHKKKCRKRGLGSPVLLLYESLSFFCCSFFTSCMHFNLSNPFDRHLRRALSTSESIRSFTMRCSLNRVRFWSRTGGVVYCRGHSWAREGRYRVCLECAPRA